MHIIPIDGSMNISIDKLKILVRNISQWSDTYILRQCETQHINIHICAAHTFSI